MNHKQKDKHMNTLQDKAYKLASTFFLASIHDEWSGSRIQAAILADPDDGDAQAVSDQQQLLVWDPIERHLESSHPMEDPYQGLDDIIDGLSDAFLQFANDSIRRVVIEHKVEQVGNTAIKFPARILPAKEFGEDFDKYEGLTLQHEEGRRNGVWVRYSQTFLYTRKSDEQLLKEFN